MWDLIRPLKKVPAPSSYKDHQPISLLWHLGKIAEQPMMILCKEVTPKLTDIQYAYLPSLGTTDVLVKVTDDWTLELDHKSNICIQAILKDFSKAFDRMQPEIIVQKLIAMEVYMGVVTLCKHFVTQRVQRVAFNGCTSDTIRSGVGLPQGTLAGPLFWVAYVNDLQPPPPTTTVVYADDTTCYNTLSETDIEVVSSDHNNTEIRTVNNNGQEAVD